MAQEAWKVLVRQRVGEAAGRCSRAHGLLVDVLGKLGTPGLVPDAPAWRAWAQRAEGMLADVSRDLADAASFMAAAGLMALRGAAVSRPSDDEALRTGLDQLRNARARAEKACHAAEVCHSRLCVVRLLLDHTHLAGVERLLDIIRVSARRDLDDARMFEQESISLACKTIVWLL